MLVATIIGFITVFQVRAQAGPLGERHYAAFVLGLAVAASFVLTLVRVYLAVAPLRGHGQGASRCRLLRRLPARASDRRAGGVGDGALRGVADRRSPSAGRNRVMDSHGAYTGCNLRVPQEHCEFARERDPVPGRQLDIDRDSGRLEERSGRT